MTEPPPEPPADEPPPPTPEPSPTLDPARAKARRRWRIRMGVLLAGLALFLYAWQIEPRWIELTEYSVGQGPRTVKVLHVTDVHIHELGSLEQWVLDTAAERKPDLIVVTGDMVNTPLPEPARDAAIEFLRQLEAPLGVYAVRGNHDEWSGERGLSVYADAGVKLLEGEQVSLLDGALVLHGLPKARTTPTPATDGYDVALCHYPASLPVVAEAGHELLLVGHSHGGQVQIPLYGAVWLPGNCDDYAEGWFEQGKTKMFVCRGVGTSIAQLRFACRPELAEITIHLPE